MADDLKPADGGLPEAARTSDRRAVRDGPTRIEPGFADVATDNPLPRPASLRLVALILALVVATGFLSWRAYFYQEEGDPVASAMLAFEKQNSLTVFASRFEVVAESEYEQSIATVPVRRVRQAMIVPATIEYRLDLSAMDSGDFRWDEAAGLLTVTLPQLQTSKPNIDEANARLFTEGLLNTGGSQQALSEANSRIASEKASAFAKNPEILALARAAAKEAVSQNLAVPLEVAGFDDARIEVRFEGET